ncbi:MAG TPA: D-glycero-beta-D-manno-heptose 1-phosphate adenylyltransferase [Chitinophagales bacterium]|nr:D-glycero-beta-D-manno-heptose 1-phosphate adenylyltransferase [Chitinophagales bacterium]
MIFEEKIESKILSLDGLLKRIEFWRRLGDKIVFTNGCFDILHQGHIQLLAGCNELGERTIIGVNSDSSVQQLKGPARPVNDQQSRATLLASTQFVDAVIFFYELTPEALIHAIKPNVLVKGGDWKKEEIVGSSFVESYGGEVKTIPYLKGFSTTEIIERSKK